MSKYPGCDNQCKGKGWLNKHPVYFKEDKDIFVTSITPDVWSTVNTLKTLIFTFDKLFETLSVNIFKVKKCGILET